MFENYLTKYGIAKYAIVKEKDCLVLMEFLEDGEFSRKSSKKKKFGLPIHGRLIIQPTFCLYYINVFHLPKLKRERIYGLIIFG